MLSQVNTPHSLMEIDIKQEMQDYSMDLMVGNSSNPSCDNKNVLSDMKDILEMHGTSLEYLKDVNELDIESVEEPKVEKPDGVEEEEEEKINIDPDDDMAGIMMELQKDREKTPQET